MLDVVLLSFCRELRTLFSNDELLHFLLVESILFFGFAQVFRYSIFDANIIVSVVVGGYIFWNLVAKLKIGHFEIHLWLISCTFVSWLIPVSNVIGGLLSIVLTFFPCFLSNIEIAFSAEFNHFLSFSSLFFLHAGIHLGFFYRLLYHVLSERFFRHFQVISPQAKMCSLNLQLFGHSPLLGHIYTFHLLMSEQLSLTLLLSILGEPEVWTISWLF